jgi:hypothetical protein
LKLDFINLLSEVLDSGEVLVGEEEGDLEEK